MLSSCLVSAMLCIIKPIDSLTCSYHRTDSGPKDLPLQTRAEALLACYTHPLSGGLVAQDKWSLSVPEVMSRCPVCTA